jgi:cysteinyl-tRNA synthetase
MPDREKALEDFEYAVRRSHGEGWDYVDGLTTEDGFKILALMKEYDTQVQYRDDHIAEYEKEIKRLNKLVKEQEAEIRQLRLALDIAKGTCKGIVVETDEKFMGDL